MGGARTRRLCALAILGVVVVAPPPVLAATCNVPRPVVAVVAGLVGSGSGGLCVPASPVGALLGFVVLSVWVYLLLVAALRALAVLGTRTRISGSARLLIVTNHFVGGGWVRRLVDVAIGIGMMAASGSGQLSPPPGTSSPSMATAGGLVREVGLAEQVSALLGLDDPGVRIADPREGEERLYTVQTGDTLALIAERELGDADLWAWLFELNKGRLMPDGQRLEWPDELRAGWVLVLPPANLVHTAPPSMPEGTAPATTGPQSSTPTPPTTSPQRPRHPVVSVELPSGSVVAFSLWLAMSTALLVALLRNRRARRPAPPEPGICRYQPETAGVAEQLAASARAAAQTEDYEAMDGSRPEAPTYVGEEDLAVPSLADLTCEDPGRVPVGERDGETVDLDLAGIGALVLGGPDAVRVARAAVVTLLAQRGPLAAELLVVGDLLPGVEEFPGLRHAPDLAAALTVLEAEIIHRRRLLDAEELDDFTDHRRGHPDDPLPALVLLADQVPARQTGRLEALIAQGRRLGCAAAGRPRRPGRRRPGLPTRSARSPRATRRPSGAGLLKRFRGPGAAPVPAGCGTAGGGSPWPVARWTAGRQAPAARPGRSCSRSSPAVVGHQQRVIPLPRHEDLAAVQTGRPAEPPVQPVGRPRAPVRAGGLRRPGDGNHIEHAASWAVGAGPARDARAGRAHPARRPGGWAPCGPRPVAAPGAGPGIRKLVPLSLQSKAGYEPPPAATRKPDSRCRTLEARHRRGYDGLSHPAQAMPSRSTKIRSWGLYR